MSAALVILPGDGSGRAWDVTGMTCRLTLSRRVSGQPGRLSFTLEGDPPPFEEGARVTLYGGGEAQFLGWVFARSRTQRQTQVTAYDQTRYLSNRDSRVFSGMRCEDIFEQVCADFRISARVEDPGGIVLPSKAYHERTLADILEDAFALTKECGGPKLMMRDEMGVLTLRKLGGRESGVIVGDGGLATGYREETSIDTDTFGAVKLLRRAGAGWISAERRDEEALSRWGFLRYNGVVDEPVNSAQLEERAGTLLALKARATHRLVMTAPGDWRAVPGDLARVRLDGGEGDRVLTEVTHTVRGGEHEMRVVLTGG